MFSKFVRALLPEQVNRLLLLLVALSTVTVSVGHTEPRVDMIGPALRSTDLERSKQFYTTGLGMVVAREIKLGAVTEVILSFGADRSQPVLLLYKDSAPGNAPPIEHGNGYGRLVLRVSDAEALIARLSAAGYAVGDVHKNSVNNMKVFWVADPDGYKYEITEVSAPRP